MSWLAGQPIFPGEQFKAWAVLCRVCMLPASYSLRASLGVIAFSASAPSVLFGCCLAAGLCGRRHVLLFDQLDVTRSQRKEHCRGSIAQ